MVINKKYPFGYYTCIEGWGYKKEQFNSSFIEVQDFRAYNFHGSVEHKMEKFFDTIPKIKSVIEHKCNKCGFEHNIPIEGITSFFA